jgi:DNA-binding PadR family transcriptional regulator
MLGVEPRHGYDLTREFSSETVLGDIVHLEPGMLYAHLKKLERNGWISAEVEAQDSRPPRRVFSITAAGQAELQRWLREPVEKTRDIRIEFLLKLFLSRMVDPELAQRLIDDQREICQGFVDSLAQQIAAEDDDFRVLVLRMRLAQNQAILDWLSEASREIAAG